jgi:hypothetical protein
MPMIVTSQKGENWLKFSAEVLDHIETYVCKQYGDATDGNPSGNAWAMDFAECVKNAQKYLVRVGKNARPGQDRLDLLKAVHYIQMAATYQDLQNEKRS